MATTRAAVTIVALLAPLALGSHTAGQAAGFKCFETSQRWPRLTWLQSQTIVRIVEGTWAEASVVPRLAGIIFREILDYDIGFKTVSGTPNMYKALADDEADVALVLWPANYEKTSKAAALAQTDPESETGLSMSIIGSSGYRARSGWYVPAVNPVKAKAAAWGSSNVLYFPGVQAALVKAKELPVTNRCSSSSVPDESLIAPATGVYDCADGSWYLSSATCCPRAVEAAGNCAAGQPSCLAVVVDTPGYDVGFNEALVRPPPASYQHRGSSRPATAADDSHPLFLSSSTNVPRRCMHCLKLCQPAPPPLMAQFSSLRASRLSTVTPSRLRASPRV